MKKTEYVLYDRIEIYTISKEGSIQIAATSIMLAKLLFYIHIYFHTTIVIFPENHLNETLHRVSLYE